MESRFGLRMFQLSEMRRDQFVLDTYTGRLWQIVKNEKDDTLLQEVRYLDPVLGDCRTPAPDSVVTDYQKNLKNTWDKFLKPPSK